MIAVADRLAELRAQRNGRLDALGGRLQRGEITTAEFIVVEREIWAAFFAAMPARRLA